ncbi:cadherin domain-containing protein [Rhizobium sp.]
MTTTTLTGENGTIVTIEYSELADETSQGTVIANVTVTAAMGHTLSELFLEIPSGVVDGGGNNLQHSLGYSIDGGATIVSSYNEGLWPPGATTYTFQLVATKDIDFSDFSVVGELPLTPFIGLDDSSVYDEFDPVEVPVAEEIETNLPPADLALSNATVSEAARAGSVVGLLSATDPDGDAITWSLVADEGDNNDFFALKTNTDGSVSVVLKAPLDFEGLSGTNGVYDLVVKATDSEGNATTKSFEITSTDELILMAASPTGKNYVSVMENADKGQKIGFFVDFDDRSTPLTATLIDDAGGKFDIKTSVVDGVTRSYLVVKGALDFETEDLYSVTVRATDADGNSQDKTYDIHVLDAAETGDTARGRIRIDASTALAAANGGVNWDSYIDAAYKKVESQLPNGVTFAPTTSEEYLYSYDGNKVISLKGAELAYWWSDPDSGEDVHVVGGTVNSLAFGEKTGDAVALDKTELSITGLDLSNGHELMDRIYGEANAMAAAWMHGANGNSPAEIEFVKALLASYAQDFVGSKGNDKYTGTIFDDGISGGKGKDVLRGGAGNDTIDGGAGFDKLYGGAGADTFVFEKGDTSNKRSQADTIYDFKTSQGDTIDLSGWDANSKKSGNQDFKFIGNDAFNGKAGELHFVKGKSDTWIEGDTNGDKKADFVIHLDDAMKLKIDHFDL